MATLKIEASSEGKVWVTLTRFGAEDLARLKAIPGHRWNPERKQWSFPDTPETRRALVEMVALPPSAPPKMIAVKPHPPLTPPAVQGENRRQGRGRYAPGRDKPLTLNPPHPLIKKVDDELVLLDASSRAQLIARGTGSPLVMMRQVWRTRHGRVMGSICGNISPG